MDTFRLIISLSLEIEYVVQICARFTNDPRESHKQAILRIRRYLISTKEEGIIFKPEKGQDIEL